MRPITWQGREIEPTDTCYRCGLRRATRELEEREGTMVRLCDDCYWGQTPPSEPGKETSAA